MKISLILGIVKTNLTRLLLLWLVFYHFVHVLQVIE